MEAWQQMSLRVGRAKNKKNENCQKVPQQYLSHPYHLLLPFWGDQSAVDTKKMSVWSALVNQKNEGPECSGHSNFG